jgi:ABC-type polysaccharide/polyol phosphate export permease
MNRFFERFRKNVLTQLFTYLAIMIISGILSNWLSWTYPIMVVMAILIAFYISVFVVAGIVNFIKDLRK